MIYFVHRDKYLSVLDELRARKININDLDEEARNRYLRQIRANFDPNEPYYPDIIIGQGNIPEEVK